MDEFLDTNIALINNAKLNGDHPDAVNPGGNTLRFIIAETGDGVRDSTVHLSGLTGDLAKRRHQAADAT